MELKGDRRGIRCLAHGYADWASMVSELTSLLDRQQPFLGESRIAVEVDSLPLSAELLAGVAAAFANHPRLHLTGIFRTGEERPTAAPPREISGALVVKTALRSGQVVEHSGDVVILGDVKPGARVVAGGDIFVLGRLAGMVAAGQPEGETARVYAFWFEPNQVRIGPVLAAPAQEPARGPEFATLEEGHIVVAPWREAPVSQGTARRRAAR